MDVTRSLGMAMHILLSLHAMPIAANTRLPLRTIRTI